MNFFVKVGIGFLAIIFIILSFAGLASFSLVIAKIAIFNQTKGELKLHPMDYVYLTMLVLGISGVSCFNSTKRDDGKSSICGISGILISLTIMILYTIFTKNEMGSIPFFCPADYPYSSQLIRTACQVRAANLLIMWITPALTLLIIIAAAAISFCCCNGKQNNSINV